MWHRLLVAEAWYALLLLLGVNLLAREPRGPHRSSLTTVHRCSNGCSLVAKEPLWRRMPSTCAPCRNSLHDTGRLLEDIADARALFLQAGVEPICTELECVARLGAIRIACEVGDEGVERGPVNVVHGSVGFVNLGFVT